VKTLFIDCGMGAAGDMLTAALLELLPDREAILEELNGLGIHGVCFSAEKSEKCGITGTHMTVTVNGEEEDEGCDENHGDECHHHSSLGEIHDIIDSLSVSDKVKADAKAVYDIIAAAESKVHGVSVSEVHFHEVGALDAIADVTAVCLLLEKIGAERIIASPVHTGKGTVKCAHGILSVPAPATAEILTGIPVYQGDINGELCTPTGAALLRHFVDEFGDMPVMTVEKTGYGMGKKDFERSNCVRIMYGETAEKTQVVSELMFNVDDMTAEEIGFASEVFFAAGAYEVFTIPAGMKKSRPGTLVTVMCGESRRDEMIRLIFRNTSTIGVREQLSRRYTLDREMSVVHTPMGDVRKKTVCGYGVSRAKYEFDDLRKIAEENGISLSDARKSAELNDTKGE